MSKQKDLEEFWQGDFGNDYIGRHDEGRMIPAKKHMFQTMLRKADQLESAVELGTNKGFNLRVLGSLYPGITLSGAEINEKAAELARQYPGVDSIYNGSLFDMPEDRKFDLAMTTFVLIHIHPDALPAAYAKLYNLTKKYVLICEYHNPSPVTINYRGHEERLFKRDFAGGIMDAYPDLSLVDYGFFYSRDPRYGLTDSNWFLMEKTAS